MNSQWTLLSSSSYLGWATGKRPKLRDFEVVNHNVSRNFYLFGGRIKECFCQDKMSSSSSSLFSSPHEKCVRNCWKNSRHLSVNFVVRRWRWRWRWRRRKEAVGILGQSPFVKKMYKAGSRWTEIKRFHLICNAVVVVVVFAGALCSDIDDIWSKWYLVIVKQQGTDFKDLTTKIFRNI